jgi:ABC-type multidrug transport system permease subunit
MIAIMWREFKVGLTSLVTTTLHFITPLFLLIFFATVLSRNLTSFSYRGLSVGYIDYFTPGLIGFLTFMTFQIALAFVRHDRVSGMLGIVMLTRGGLGSYVSGKTVAQSIINLIKATLLVMVALLISDGDVALARFVNLALIVVAIVLGSTVWLALGVLLGLLMTREDIREVMVMVISMPLTFGSSMYYDISRAPGWIRAISDLNPLTYTCDLARKAYLLESVGPYSREISVLLIMAALSLAAVLIVSRRIGV